MPQRSFFLENLGQQIFFRDLLTFNSSPAEKITSVESLQWLHALSSTGFLIITLFKLPTLNATSEHFTPLHIGEKLERAFDLST